MSDAGESMVAPDLLMIVGWIVGAALVLIAVVAVMALIAYLLGRTVGLGIRLSAYPEIWWRLRRRGSR